MKKKLDFNRYLKQATCDHVLTSAVKALDGIDTHSFINDEKLKKDRWSHSQIIEAAKKTFDSWLNHVDKATADEIINAIDSELKKDSKLKELQSLQKSEESLKQLIKEKVLKIAQLEAEKTSEKLKQDEPKSYQLSKMAVWTHQQV